MPAIFTRTTVPKTFAASIVDESIWFTWSPSFRRFLTLWATEVKRLRSPTFRTISGVKDYPGTYALPLGQIPSQLLRNEIRGYARQLYNLPIPRKLWLLTDLYDHRITGSSLHYLFAALRSELVQLGDSEASAIHPGLPRFSADETDFPIHADLWKGELLFIVFDRITMRCGGASIFWKVSELRAFLRETSAVPRLVRQELEELFACPHRDGSFDRLFDLLHTDSYPWSRALRRRMRAECRRISFRPGQGYLVHDRTWLHGREKLREPPLGRRLHRLVFNTQVLERPGRSGR